MHLFKYFPLFLGVALALPAPEAESLPDANPLLDARACTYSLLSFPNHYMPLITHALIRWLRLILLRQVWLQWIPSLWQFLCKCSDYH